MMIINNVDFEERCNYFSLMVLHVKCNQLKCRNISKRILIANRIIYGSPEPQLLGQDNLLLDVCTINIMCCLMHLSTVLISTFMIFQYLLTLRDFSVMCTLSVKSSR